MGTKPSRVTERLRGPSCFLGGMLSILVQTVVLRESLFGEHQAELASGIVLASWIVGAGMGAALGGRMKRNVYAWRWGILIMPFLGYLQLLSCRISQIPLPLTVLPLGAVAGIVFIQPFAFGRPGFIYSMEALGAALGGIVFVILSPVLLAGEMLGLSVLAAASALAQSGRPVRGVILAGVAAMAFLGGFPSQFSQLLGRLSLPDYQEVRVLPSQYGELVTAGRLGQSALFRGGVLETTWPALESAEAAVVVPLAASMPGSVLYIGSSPEEAAIIAEWNSVRSSATVVQDEALRSAASYPPGTLTGDGRAYLDDTDRRFDLIAVSVGQPLTLLSNRFYTEEFMKVLSESITENGMAALRLPGGSNRLHPLEAQLAGSVLMASLQHFRWAEVLPISGIILIMGNGEEPDLDGRTLAGVLDSLGFQGLYVNQWTLPYDLSQLRVRSFEEQVADVAAAMNRDLHPTGFNLARQLWSLRTGDSGGSGYIVPSVFLLLILTVAASAMTGEFMKTMGVASAAFTGLSVEVTALVAMQAATGLSWVLVGAVTGLFMTGAALGALAAQRRLLRRPAVFIFLSGAVAFLCAAVLHLYDSGLLTGGAISAVLLSGSMLSGAFGGGAFTSAAISLGEGTGRIGLLGLAEYSASAAAGLLVPLILFPAQGAAAGLLMAGGWSLLWAFLQPG